MHRAIRRGSGASADGRPTARSRPASTSRSRVPVPQRERAAASFAVNHGVPSGCSPRYSKRMSVSGPGGAASLLASLNPQALLRLANDLLFVRGHRSIRLTDGPGDGGRDIHSTLDRGDVHLTQSKWHKDIDQACSSDELSELPMAMTKFGYRRGLFVTNARISPQGKREYLDSYPGLALEFLDGETLAQEVLNNGLLRAVWLSNGRIERIDSAVFIPFIVRKHDRDVPVVPRRYFRTPDPTELLRYVKQNHPRLDFDIRSARSTAESFPHYRPPEWPSVEEGLSSHFEVTEVCVTPPCQDR